MQRRSHVHISSDACNMPLPQSGAKLNALRERNSCLISVLLCQSLIGTLVSLCVINLSPPSASHSHPQILTSRSITDHICWHFSARAASLSNSPATQYHCLLLFFKMLLLSLPLNSTFSSLSSLRGFQ